MGMKLFSSGRMYINPAPTDPNPNRFKVEFAELCGAYTIAVVYYPGCTTFEGHKLLVFEGDQREALASVKRLDPHFSADALSPVARFKPDGLGHARTFCEAATRQLIGPRP